MVNCDFKMKHTLFQTHVMVEYGNWKTKNSFLKHIWWNQMPAKNSVMMLMENLRNIWWNTISDIEIPIHQMSLFMVLFHHHLNQYILVPPKTSQVTMREPPISKGPTSAPRTTPCCFSTIIGVEGGTEKKQSVKCWTQLSVASWGGHWRKVECQTQWHEDIWMGLNSLIPSHPNILEYLIIFMFVWGCFKHTYHRYPDLHILCGGVLVVHPAPIYALVLKWYVT